MKARLDQERESIKASKRKSSQLGHDEINHKGLTIETPQMSGVHVPLSNNQSEQTLHMGYSKNYAKESGINSSKARNRYASVDFDGAPN